ncbi:YdcF family protein [Paenibacillus endoradicis]|uniref:YdcF family protein n=1 Tax=Paenibacillus endoradicis TaxID=2972487 RepID=UPI002158A7A1|nr:YdcF family protein [Paenibacillus endoradicis]MCR8656055.1 YdcF family protein [Paenibacillus endoradicis]MCR8658381.1 YdcF family protein [Paenibacillus endoradicis]
MTKKLRIKLVVSIITILFVFVAYSGVSIWSFSNNFQLVKSDVAVVLGAAAWDSEPSPVLRERINHAIWLYENGYVDNIIFTGGKGSGDQYAESEVARGYAIQRNVDPDHIFIETKSKITEENLTYAYEIAVENHFTTFTIVSDPLHMKRAMLMAKQTGMDAYSSPTQSSAYKSLNSKIPFFLRELFFYVGYIFSLPFR